MTAITTMTECFKRKLAKFVHVFRIVGTKLLNIFCWSGNLEDGEVSALTWYLALMLLLYCSTCTNVQKVSRQVWELCHSCSCCFTSTLTCRLWPEPWAKKNEHLKITWMPRWPLAPAVKDTCSIAWGTFRYVHNKGKFCVYKLPLSRDSKRELSFSTRSLNLLFINGKALAVQKKTKRKAAGQTWRTSCKRPLGL